MTKNMFLFVYVCVCVAFGLTHLELAHYIPFSTKDYHFALPLSAQIEIGGTHTNRGLKGLINGIVQ